jgi:uncharacterized membrane protein YqaE (UPF0057 family)
MPLNVSEKNAPKAKLENAFFDEHKMNMSLEEIASLTPKKFQEITGKKLSLKETIAFKMAQKQLKKQMKNPNGEGIPKGLYIVLAIFGWGFIGIGLATDWKGNDWWVCLLLSFLCWIPGVIYALVKMKNYNLS